MTCNFVVQAQPQQRRTIVLKAPRRITITIPHSTFENLVQRSDEQGRSLSNLAAYLLERGCLDISDSKRQ